MKAKKIFLRWLLPAALAAAMLAAGTFVPSLLLRRQAQQLRRGASAVAVEDVRPYGDDYEDMKNALLAAIRLVEEAEDAEDYGLQDAQDAAGTEEAFSGFMDFQRQLLDSLSSRGYWLDSLYNLEYDYYGSVSGSSGEDWVLRTEGYDPYSGEYSDFLVQPEYYVPVRASVYIVPADYFSPQAMWDSLLEAYRDCCDLNFTGTQVETSLFTGVSETLDEETFLDGWLAAGTVVDSADGVMFAGGAPLSCAFSAVSSDLTFRLQLEVTILDGIYWNLELRLQDNTEN